MDCVIADLSLCHMSRLICLRRIIAGLGCCLGSESLCH